MTQVMPFPDAYPARQRALKKVVIVDDSTLLRKWLRMVLESNPRLIVVGEAGDAQQARAVIKATAPDVITLDIDMPGMSGLAFLEKLMQLHPLPVVMFSGMTRANSESTVTALMLGAVDCLEKPMNGTELRQRDNIARRVFAAACSSVRARHKPRQLFSHAPNQQPIGREPLVMIGASTGGVSALETIVSGLDPGGPPVVIVQHMRGAYLISFSQLLDRSFEQDVKLARPGQIITRGQVVLAPALGQHTEIIRRGDQWECLLCPDTEEALHCPSVDRLFGSGVPFAKDVIAVILTGLGRDGAASMKSLRDAGATTLGQDKSSSTVYGMPRAAWDLGAVGQQYALENIAEAINTAAAKHRGCLAKRL